MKWNTDQHLVEHVFFPEKMDADERKDFERLCSGFRKTKVWLTVPGADGRSQTVALFQWRGFFRDGEGTRTHVWRFERVQFTPWLRPWHPGMIRKTIAESLTESED